MLVQYSLFGYFQSWWFKEVSNVEGQDFKKEASNFDMCGCVYPFFLTSDPPCLVYCCSCVRFNCPFYTYLNLIIPTLYNLNIFADAVKTIKNGNL